MNTHQKKKQCAKIAVAAGASIILSGSAVADQPIANVQEAGVKDTGSESIARKQWWKDARFGMFIHWGIYSVPAGVHNGKEIPWLGEWIMNKGQIPVAEYRKYAKDFNPHDWNAEAVVRLAKAAGMKYIVITTKHHDGFAMYDSDVSDWNIMDATPFGRDPIAELATACREHGIKLGFYYSQAQDWSHKGGEAWQWGEDPNRPGKHTWLPGGHWDEAQKGAFDAYLKNIALPQVEEILTKYGDIAVIWFDTPAGMTKERAEPFMELVKKHHPRILINNRLGGGFKGDFTTPEQNIPATGLDYDWETCMTMNDTWGYKTTDHSWKGPEVLINMLIETSSKGGNFLLNIGPDERGNIPAPTVNALLAVSEWMDVNSEAIYETDASRFLDLKCGKSTTRDLENGNTRLYFHVQEWPKDGTLNLPVLKNKILSAQVLGSDARVQHKPAENGILLSGLPSAPVSKFGTVIAIEVEGSVAPETKGQ